MQMIVSRHQLPDGNAYYYYYLLLVFFSGHFSVSVEYSCTLVTLLYAWDATQIHL